MNLRKLTKTVLPACLLAGLLTPAVLRAQTDMDGIMMKPKLLCAGGMYSYNSWSNYWEGTLKRNNQNIGTVTTQMVGLMGIYGITNNLDVIAGAPYVATHASAGTLHGLHGIQDLSMWLKWRVTKQPLGAGRLSVFVLGGGSIPLTNYIPDVLPMSIGLHSKTLSGRLLVDYQVGKFFATASGTYTWRSNITIPQDAYYTTQEYLTNQVQMPNTTMENIRAGYRGKRLTAEALFTDLITLGGFDIRRNDMPFPSNKMDMTMAGIHLRYDLPQVKGLSVEGEGSYTLSGRNVGQATEFDAGVFYIFKL